MIAITTKLLKNIELQLQCKINAHRPLGNGEHNVNMLLDTTKGKLVLRIYANTQFDNAKKEFLLLKKLNGTFAPKVYYFDNSRAYFSYDYLIQEFVAGATLHKFSDKDLKEVAHVLKEIHKIQNNKTNHSEEIISAWCKKNILQNSKFLGATFHKDMKQLYNTVKEILHEIKPLLRKYHRTHLIHDDIIPENIIRKEDGSLILIDWELATYNYFFSEFGCMLAENNLSKHQEQVFLKAYGFGQNHNEKKIISAIKINRILSLISWLIERIATIKQGKQMFSEENISRYQKRLGKEIIHIHKLIQASV